MASFQIAVCTSSTRKAYLEPVSMPTLFPFPRSRAWIRTMSSANWAEVPGGKGLVSVVSELETTAYPALLFPSKTKLLSSVYRFPQDWSEDLLTILGVLSSGPKFIGKSERGGSLGCRQEGSWVKNLTRGCSQAWIVHQHYLISEDPLIRYP